MQETKFKSLLDFQETFPTEQACLDYWTELRWKGKVTSPHDPNSKVYECKDGKYKCKNTNRYFNPLTKSMFENTKLPLKKWFLALFIFASSKKGISSYQLAKYINVTPKTAWFLLERFRHASVCPIFKTLLKNFVEIDEAYIGGSNSNRHWDKKIPKCQGRSSKDKTPVLGMQERGGNLIAQVVLDTKQKTIEPIINANVKQGATVYTDEWLAYQGLSKNYKHQIVNHGKKQYVNEGVSTNSMENVWSNFKRMIGGTYHRVSKKHLQAYVDEFAFRFNTRQDISYSSRHSIILIIL